MGSLSDGLHKASFVRLLIPFISGIAIAEWLLPHKSLLYYIIPFICTILFIYFRKSDYKYDFISGFLLIFIFFSLGFSIALNNRYEPGMIECGGYFGILDEYPIEKGKSYRAEIRLPLNKCKLLAYFEKTEELSSVQPGTVLFFEGCPELIANYGNPFEFDYKSYSLRNGVGYRIYLKSNDFYFFRNISKSNLQDKALIFRQKLLNILADHGVKGETFHVISGITLGARDNLDPETTQAFIRTGTLHVLAVSGGNVAVVFILLNFLFGFLKKTRTGLFTHTLIIFSGIWGYALITGLSASVLRAAMMFTFVVIGNNFNSRPNIYNSLAASAFLLLCFNPELLFDVGFQLSYTAVAAIVFLQPIFHKVIYFRHRIIDWIWILFTVSLAAQIGTLPLSLYYFHQFPSYFWLSNMIVVPLVSVLMYFTFLVIIIVFVSPFLGILSAHLLNWIGDRMLEFLHFVENLPFAVIENIYPSVVQLILFSVAIIFSVIFIKIRKGIYAFIALCFVILFLLLNTMTYYETLSRKEIVVFNIPGKTLIAFTQGREITWLTDVKPAVFQDLNYMTKLYEGYQRIRIKHEFFLSDTLDQMKSNIHLIKNSINFQGLKIFIVNNETYNLPSIKVLPSPDVVLITDNRNAYSAAFRLNFPEAVFIHTKSPVSIKDERLPVTNGSSKTQKDEVTDSGAILITIQKCTENNKELFRTCYFNNKKSYLEKIIQ